MTSILLKTSFRHLLRHPWQVGLAILGVALGVAVVVSIDLANSSARRAFALSTQTIAGRATHQIVGGPNGLDESVYRRVRLDLGLRQSAPVVEGYAAAPDHPGLTLHILGLDPLVDAPFRSLGGGSGSSGASALASPADLFVKPGAALLSADTARAYGLKQGDELRLRIGPHIERATLIALIEPPSEAARRALDSLLIADIATAQEWLGYTG
ncbi:MAG TPA: ABC transporter permease, partial [Roseiflexaceae bacterium]|nr:ABC transporter permease [Roseiflexaceae bacterium]